MSEDKFKAMRIAFRLEGEFVNCYFASPDTMKDALLMGSMRRSILAKDQAWDLWKQMMQQIISTACENVLGVKPERFEEEPAPEHERAGRG